MQLIISVGRQDKPGIGAGSPAKESPALTPQLMHVHSHGFLARLSFSACPFRVSALAPPAAIPSLAASLTDVHILRSRRRI
jgi:hypothetical protein